VPTSKSVQHHDKLTTPTTSSSRSSLWKCTSFQMDWNCSRWKTLINEWHKAGCLPTEFQHYLSHVHDNTLSNQRTNSISLITNFSKFFFYLALFFPSQAKHKSPKQQRASSQQYHDQEWLA
jgi:hypothetical protein